MTESLWDRTVSEVADRRAKAYWQNYPGFVTLPGVIEVIEAAIREALGLIPDSERNLIVTEPKQYTGDGKGMEVEPKPFTEPVRSAPTYAPNTGERPEQVRQMTDAELRARLEWLEASIWIVAREAFKDFPLSERLPKAPKAPVSLDPSETVPLGREGQPWGRRAI